MLTVVSWCRPVVITDVIPSWPAANWSQEFFASNYGEDRVTMKDVDVSSDCYYDASDADFQLADSNI